MAGKLSLHSFCRWNKGLIHWRPWRSTLKHLLKIFYVYQALETQVNKRMLVKEMNTTEKPAWDTASPARHNHKATLFFQPLSFSPAPGSAPSPALHDVSGRQHPWVPLSHTNCGCLGVWSRWLSKYSMSLQVSPSVLQLGSGGGGRVGGHLLQGPSLLLPSPTHQPGLLMRGGVGEGQGAARILFDCFCSDVTLGSKS